MTHSQLIAVHAFGSLVSKQLKARFPLTYLSAKLSNQTLNCFVTFASCIYQICIVYTYSKFFVVVKTSFPPLFKSGGHILIVSYVRFILIQILGFKQCFCYILTFDPAQNAIQDDAPGGSDTFQWQLGEEIAWAEIG